MDIWKVTLSVEAVLSRVTSTLNRVQSKTPMDADVVRATGSMAPESKVGDGEAKMGPDGEEDGVMALDGAAEGVGLGSGSLGPEKIGPGPDWLGWGDEDGACVEPGGTRSASAVAVVDGVGEPSFAGPDATRIGARELATPDEGTALEDAYAWGAATPPKAAASRNRAVVAPRRACNADPFMESTISVVQHDARCPPKSPPTEDWLAT